jgi:hypothetical protein
MLLCLKVTKITTDNLGADAPSYSITVTNKKTIK